jgi:hypothetical protein
VHVGAGVGSVRAVWELGLAVNDRNHGRGAVVEGSGGLSDDVLVDHVAQLSRWNGGNSGTEGAALTLCFGGELVFELTLCGEQGLVGGLQGFLFGADLGLGLAG